MAYTKRTANWDLENLRVSIPITEEQALFVKKTLGAGKELNWGLNIGDSQTKEETSP